MGNRGRGGGVGEVVGRGADGISMEVSYKASMKKKKKKKHLMGVNSDQNQ